LFSGEGCAEAIGVKTRHRGGIREEGSGYRELLKMQ
jgi:hypothetical protein